MRIQPRRQILDIWRSMLAECYRDGKWVWGGRDASNPISDAEQLLCLLYPMTLIETFQVHDPDATQSDVAAALRPLGEKTRLPRVLVEIAHEYFVNHTTVATRTIEDGRGEAREETYDEPRFGGGSYLRSMHDGEPLPADEKLQGLDVVDAYSMSMTLCLSLLVFVSNRLPLEPQGKAQDRLKELRERASQRMTAAMIGLLRSFVVNSVWPGSAEGQAILGMLRQGDATDAELQQGLATRFGRLRAQLHNDVRLAVPDGAKPEPDQLFECGWSWGVATGSVPIVEYASHLEISKKPGVAVARPWLYFTVSALDGIVDLTSRRIRSLDILNDEQRRLSDALQLRWDLTQRYWSAVARFDPDRWPLEDVPWRTSDGQESIYYSLLVISVLIQDLINRTAKDPDLLKAVGIIEDLGRRGRITQRMVAGERAIELHYPGVQQGLLGSEEEMGANLALFSADYAPLIIKRSLQAAVLTDNVEAREQLMGVAEAAMQHLADRRIRIGNDVIDLWDDVSSFPGVERPAGSDKPSWYMTERVVEALVATALTYGEDTPRSARMYEVALRLLNEADRIYNQVLMQSNTEDRSTLRGRLDEIGQLLSRARELQFRRTSTAMALSERALRLLDSLDVANEDAGRSQ